MTVKELIDLLKLHDPKALVLVANDEELNQLFKGFEVAKLTDEKQPTVVIYGLSGQEYEEE